jgi:serine/alanine adding enzyme
MKIEIFKDVDDISRTEWKSLVDLSNTATFFQTPECYDFYQSLSFLEPFWLAVKVNDKLSAVICGYIIAEGSAIKKMMTRRAIIPGGALLDPEIIPDSLSLLLNNLKSLLRSKNAIYIEFRNYCDFSAYRNTFGKEFFEYLPHYNFHVDTSDINLVQSKLNSTKRRDIRSSRKNGTVWYRTESHDDMKNYYKILSDLYQTRIKTPLFPFEFFEKIIQNDFCKFFVVKMNEEIIGGSLCVELPGNILYEWFVCGLDSQFRHSFPSTIATWAAIEYAALSGLTRFDMMGAGKPDEAYGVREFKSKFGGELVEHGRFLHILNPALYSIGKLAVKILKSKVK